MSAINPQQLYGGAGIEDYKERLKEKDSERDVVKECAWIAESLINSTNNTANPAYDVGFNDAAKKIADLIWAKLEKKIA